MASLARFLPSSRSAFVSLASRAASPSVIASQRRFVGTSAAHHIAPQPSTARRTYASLSPAVNDELELNQRIVQDAYDKQYVGQSAGTQSPAELIKLIHSTRPLPFQFAVGLIEQLLIDYADDKTIYDGKKGEVREATAKHVVASAQKLHNCLLSLIKDVDFGPAQRKAHNERVYPELLSIYSSAQDWKKVYHLAGEIQKSPGVPEPFLAERLWQAATRYYNSLIVDDRDYDPMAAVVLLSSLLRNTTPKDPTDAAPPTRLPSLILARFIARLRRTFDRARTDKTEPQVRIAPALLVALSAMDRDPALRSRAALQDMMSIFSLLKFTQAERCKDLIAEIDSGVVKEKSPKKKKKASGSKKSVVTEGEAKAGEAAEEVKQAAEGAVDKAGEVVEEVKKAVGRVFQGTLKQ